jgi:hypothetical protein
MIQLRRLLAKGTLRARLPDGDFSVIGAASVRDPEAG